MIENYLAFYILGGYVGMVLVLILLYYVIKLVISLTRYLDRH